VFSKEYRKEVLLPVLQAVASRLGQPDLYQGLSENDSLVAPKTASEIEIKVRQLFRIAETLDCLMIGHTRRKVIRDMTLAQAERSREETALPTDLWKKPVCKVFCQ
jgi:hypothetical protein